MTASASRVSPAAITFMLIADRSRPIHNPQWTFVLYMAGAVYRIATFQRKPLAPRSGVKNLAQGVKTCEWIDDMSVGAHSPPRKAGGRDIKKNGAKPPLRGAQAR